MKYKLPELKYSHDALEPILSKQAVEFHYDKHTRKYYDTVNELAKGTIFEKHDKLSDIIKNGKLVKPYNKFANSVCQAWNHTFFWNSLCPESKSKISPSFKKVIEKYYGSEHEFKDMYKDLSSKFFGSGWIWLVVNKDDVFWMTTPNGETPLATKGYKPLLCIDLWEHSWYVDYPADKDKYLEEIWKIIYWKKVEKRYNDARD